MEKYIYILILAIIIIILIFTLPHLLKNNTKSFKASRIDELTDCHDYCFELYPFRSPWDTEGNEKRQQCLTQCLKPKSKNSNWVDDFNTCMNNKCGNKEKCLNICDTTILPPPKPMMPDRNQYSSQEEYEMALDKFNTYDFEYKSKLYPDYLKMKDKCIEECGDSSMCQRGCCEEAKKCNSMKDEKDMKNCKLSCSMMRMKRR